MRRTLSLFNFAEKSWRFQRPLPWGSNRIVTSTGIVNVSQQSSSPSSSSSSSPCRVLFAGSQFHAGYPFTEHVLKERGLNDETLIQLIQAPTMDDIMTLAPTCDVAIPFMEFFQKDFLRLSHKLRLIIQFGVGLERVDIDYATQLGIIVSNIPADGTGNARATSEHAIHLAISLLRYSASDLPKRLHARELGGWPAPRTIYGKRVTVVGYGCVGKVLVRYLLIMGATVQVVRKSPWKDDVSSKDSIIIHHDIENNLFIRSPSLEAALPTTDVLFLACTMTPDTYHLMNEETIAQLPHGALIINVGRGPLVEYNAILNSLKDGHIDGFASDVGVGHPSKPSEPWDPHDEISKLENTIFTPHVGGYTDYAYLAMANKIVDAIECIIDGKEPPVVVNKKGP